MKKQFAAIFAATAMLGVTTAFAANPFSDVTPDSWAYQVCPNWLALASLQAIQMVLSEAKMVLLVSK